MDLYHPLLPSGDAGVIVWVVAGGVMSLAYAGDCATENVNKIVRTESTALLVNPIVFWVKERGLGITLMLMDFARNDN